MRRTQNGHVLLLCLILLFSTGFVAAALQDNLILRQKAGLQQQARQAETLEQIRSSLMGFAASQGIHSQSHLGHLPCPATIQGDFSATICLDKPWGYLPVRSKSAINYLNAGVDPRINLDRMEHLKDWEYAVSAQLVQPNQLNWGRWVDYSQPAIQIRVPEENNRVQQQLAAVIAKSIKSTGPHQYDITPPYTLITVAELQAAMSRQQVRLIHETLTGWKRINPQAILQLSNHENLVPHSAGTNRFQAVDSACSCRCTRTRCNCSCAGTGRWRSRAACWGTASNCQTLATHSLCTSDTSQPCVFSGPAQMDNSWPVSRFEPAAASNKSCRPTHVHECPLSQNATNCTCDFSWPDSSKSKLPDLVIQLEQTP